MNGQARHPAAALACSAASLAVFVALAAAMACGMLAHIDQQAVLALAAHRSPWVTHAARFMAELHETVTVLVVTGCLAAWLALRRHWRSAAVLLAVPLGMLLNFGLKHLFQRARPSLAEPLAHLAGYSFPSGHAVAATLFYGALCALVFAHRRAPAPRRLAVGLGLAMVGAVGFCRVYLGVHYPSDVFAGVFLGGAWLLAWLHLLQRRGLC